MQTSAMDCGPAALTCLLEGFGIPSSYARLREACQTDVDGTSINTLEDVAQQLGLQAEQMMAPADHLLLPAAQLLPALVVTVLPNGFNHFVVAWRTHGPFVQVMDPALGRRWMRHADFMDEVYRYMALLRRRGLAGMGRNRRVCHAPAHTPPSTGLGPQRAATLMKQAAADPSWRGFGCVGRPRMVSSMVAAHGLARGAESAPCWRNALRRHMPAQPLISLWSLRPFGRCSRCRPWAPVLQRTQTSSCYYVRRRVDQGRARHGGAPAC
ncbi:MAG: cysteine peptidase family C39 domain-containing protein [Caldilineaceae bacterium]